jgi:SAM-dependent methyltransferase
MSENPEIIRHPLYGLAVPGRNWVPAPTYVLRRRRILNLLSAFAPGRLLEVGSGAGAMLADLSRMGHRCDALETSPEARSLAGLINGGDGNVAVHGDVQNGWEGAFDTVLSMEVLEHIEDDAAALRDWAAWLRQDGRLILSVPAHPCLWNASDVWAGHFRRYERDGLREVVESAGFRVEHMECYGFPLSNIIEPVRARVHARRLDEEKAAEARPTEDGHAHGSARSGTERGIETRLYPLQASWVGGLAMRLFFGLQYLFRGKDLGTGYIVIAVKRE